MSEWLQHWIVYCAGVAIGFVLGACVVLLASGCIASPEDFKREPLKNYPAWYCSDDDDAGEPYCRYVQVIEV